jgi:serine kinase of HPr protein (carbohydrate metabolism regulator)
MLHEPTESVHATAVLVGDRGVLISGNSGAGKSSIANELMRRAGARDAFAAVISDDRCVLRAASGRLICNGPNSLQGGLEVRGSGLHRVDCEPAGVIHLVVELVDSSQAIRFADDTKTVIAGISIPSLALPERAIEAVCRAVEARLFSDYWQKK